MMLTINKYCLILLDINVSLVSKYRGQPNRGYKKPNPNPNILSTIFGSYNRGRIVQKGIRFIRN